MQYVSRPRPSPGPDGIENNPSSFIHTGTAAMLTVPLLEPRQKIELNVKAERPNALGSVFNFSNVSSPVWVLALNDNNEAIMKTQLAAEPTIPSVLTSKSCLLYLIRI